MAIGQNIAWVRKQLGMTQRELAERVGISREYLVSIETGKKPSKRTLAIIAQALKVTMRELENDNDKE